MGSVSEDMGILAVIKSYLEVLLELSKVDSRERCAVDSHDLKYSSLICRIARN